MDLSLRWNANFLFTLVHSVLYCMHANNISISISFPSPVDSLFTWSRQCEIENIVPNIGTSNMSRLAYTENGTHWIHDNIFICIFNDIRIIPFDCKTDTPFSHAVCAFVLFIFICIFISIIEMKKSFSFCMHLMLCCILHLVVEAKLFNRIGLHRSVSHWIRSKAFSMLRA